MCAQCVCCVCVWLPHRLCLEHCVDMPSFTMCIAQGTFTYSDGSTYTGDYVGSRKHGQVPPFPPRRGRASNHDHSCPLPSSTSTCTRPRPLMPPSPPRARNQDRSCHSYRQPSFYQRVIARKGPLTMHSISFYLSSFLCRAQGTMQYSSGASYTGQWEKGLQHGKVHSAPPYLSLSLVLPPPPLS
jgi:hypothetical protein